MRVSVCQETHSTIRFHAECPVCHAEFESCVYTLDNSFLSEESIRVHFTCQDDGEFSIEGSLQLTFTESV